MPTFDYLSMEIIVNSDLWPKIRSWFFKLGLYLSNYFTYYNLQDITDTQNDLASSDDDDAIPKPPNEIVTHPKPTIKAKLSNSSSKSGDEGSLHFDLPEHLKANVTNNETIVEEEEKVTGKKQKKSKKSKEKKHHKKRKSIDKERDELEEFLNGIPPSNMQTDEGAYEEL